MPGTSSLHTNAAEGAVKRTAERFARATSRPWTYHYVVGKLRGDPATRAVLDLAPLGHVLDLGCGRGQLAVALLESGAASSVCGVDWDAEKVDLAGRAAEGLAARFEQGDVRDGALEAADTVLLVDVLHYFDRDSQDVLLKRASELLRPGGRLVVRDATLGLGWRSTLTLAVERIATGIRLNRGERVVLRDVARELVPALEGGGMTCAVTPCSDGTPFGNVLLVATKARP